MNISAVLACALQISTPVSTADAPPPARRVNATETLHGVAVADPYRWLEEPDAPEVREWVAAQNGVAEAFVSATVPQTYERLLTYSNFATTRAYQRWGSTVFYLQGWAGSPHTGLYVEVAGGAARHLAGSDVSRRDANTQDESVASYWPSPDGRLVLVLQRPRDSRWGRLHLIDVATGNVLRSAANVYHGFTSATWLADGSAFVYSSYEREGDAPVRPRILRQDVAAGPERTLFESDPSAAAQILYPRSATDSNRLFVEVHSGSSGTNRVYAIEPGGGSRIDLFQATASWLFLGARGDDAWFYTNQAAPNGRVVRIRDISGRRAVETVIAEGSGAISATSQVGGNAYGLFGDRIALIYREQAVPVLRIFDLGGQQTAELEIPPTGSLWGGLDGDPRRAEAYYQFLGIAEPASIYRVDLANGRRERITTARAPIGPDDFVARRIFVDRGSGIRIPVLIAHRRGLSLDRPRRTIMYGYGAFGWASFLWYQPHVVDWLLRDDGLFVVAGVRGGGEFGSAWHQAGIGANRQTAIDDYVAVARHLVDARITRPQLLVANGGSISGGLVAAAVNQHPELFGAMTLDYPLLDLVRYTRFGSARYWTGELGSPDDPAQFATLLAYSPYHNVRDGICYPATLVRTGEHDPTVTPTHGFKFAAHLQHATSCDRPVMLDVMEGASHDYGATSEQIARSHTLMLEFLRRTLPAQ